MSWCECICWHVDTSWQLWGWCKMLGVSVWLCSLERGCPGWRGRGRGSLAGHVTDCFLTSNYRSFQQLLITQHWQMKLNKAPASQPLNIPQPTSTGLMAVPASPLISPWHHVWMLCQLSSFWVWWFKFELEKLSFSSFFSRKLMWVTAIKSYISNFYWFCRTPT